ncbi:hypothetical protein SAMN02745132_04669, partial [Enterovibrio nigricans DSM 22720]
IVASRFSSIDLSNKAYTFLTAALNRPTPSEELGIFPTSPFTTVSFTNKQLSP